MKSTSISKKVLSFGALFLYALFFLFFLFELYRFYKQTSIPLDFLKYYQFGICSFIVYLVVVFAGFLFSLLGYYILKKRKWLKPKFNLLFFLLFIFIYSILNTLLLSQALEKKEVVYRLDILDDILENRDLYAEKKALQILSRMSKDTILQSKVARIPLLDRLSYEDSIISYIESVYFEKQWNAYYFQFTFCSSHSTLLIGENEQKVCCEDYFRQKISSVGTSLDSERQLYRMNHGLDYYSYLLTTSFPHCIRDSVRLFIEIIAPAIYSDMGYLDSNYRGVFLGNDYSYAIYENENLLSHGGSYIYPMISEVLRSKNANGFYFNDDYSHLVVKFEAGRFLVISKEYGDFWCHMQYFSFFFLLFFLFGILLFGGYKLVFKRQQYSFAYRLQFVMLSVLLGSLVLIGGASLWYLQEFNYNKNEQVLREKTLSAILNMERRYMDRRIEATSLLPYMQRLAAVLYADINIYDTNGVLWLTTEPHLFNEEFQTNYINPLAFKVLKEKKSNLYLHFEKVKDQRYLSSYSPFRNSKNQVIAYVNLPYFSAQTKLRDEIAYYVSVYLNLCLLLILLAVFVAVMLSNRIVKPLKMMGKYVADVELGKKNMKIEWNSKDEIGDLILKYNALLDELDHSAQLLASSERQSAWAEMASQVAHEIKNPLTPMKLQAQLLQRVYQSKPDDFEEKLNKFVEVLEEQINLLSAIATNFANFAQITTVNYSNQNIRENILKAIDLFSSDVDYHIFVDNQLEKDVYVQADETQLVQVWTNLFKNAVQAISEGHKGLIEVKISREGDLLLVAVKDDGSGIEADQLIKIFEPHFTTKTSGTGLGLFICKRIIENMQGSISVESRVGIGSVFYVKLPIAEA